ncbi:hypothetical protein [Streptomyces europaeiscabiei]|uniref:hypothetical protein n=1 Tax=Streptomyces europaeiscabiei TaxID=146819 RepID=UPI002E0E3194|nr:hypothetical protein OHB30_11855 [Streptomyces europaeiscabiei]
MRTLRTTALVTAPPLLLAVAGLTHPRHLTAATADHWAGLHIVLLPAFPLLVLGLLVPLWGRPRRDAEGALTVLAWAGCFTYAAYYTGLDAVAGIGAGTAAGTGVRGVVGRLFATGNELGRAGVYALAIATLATGLVLLLRHGARVLPGVLVVLGACWSFAESHIFWPRGVLSMLGFALGFGLLVLASRTGDDKRARATAGSLTNS